MYRDKKTAIKRVRRIGGETFSNPTLAVKRNLTRSLTSSYRVGLPAKHTLTDAASFFAGARILADKVHRLLHLADPEFGRNFLVFPAHAQFQPVARPLLLQPAI